MATGNLSDAVGHGHDGEAEGEGMASSLMAVDPVAIPPTTMVPQPIKTKANVPMNSAIAFFMARSPEKTPDPEAGLSYLQVRVMTTADIWPTLARPHRDDLSRNHANSSGSSRREVEASILHERSPVIHSNVYRLAISRVADDETGTKWQRSVSSG